ncbi:nuclear transport factor 2 family protein [Actinomadura fulvescens]|uniref:Nuclear transport factor 2 family protein n=1 Tax=Actinomadura fulvescens TaxID=46160 RepID=A0ABN3PT46_9ACTN
MSAKTAPVDVAVAFLEAWSSRDMDAVAGYVADDVVFESPKVRLTGAQAVVEAMGQFAQAVISVKLIAAYGDDERALVMYDMETGPFGTLRAADHFVVQDGKIKSDELVFDTYELRKFEESQA